MVLSSDISHNLLMVRQRMQQASKNSPLAQPNPILIAVSKTHPAESIEMAISAGQKDFGENRVQEALAKWPKLKQRHPDIVLHCIGPLQTNKVRDAVALFDVIHTLDRPKLAEALAKEMEKSGKRPQCFIEINTGEEPQKAGVSPKEVADFISLCRDNLQLPLVGLMCIPPVNEPPAPHFALLHELAKQHELPSLSMGMSGDFETALRMGATHIRVGTSIFGERTGKNEH